MSRRTSNETSCISTGASLRRYSLPRPRIRPFSIVCTPRSRHRGAGALRVDARVGAERRRCPPAPNDVLRRGLYSESVRPSVGQISRKTPDPSCGGAAIVFGARERRDPLLPDLKRLRHTRRESRGRALGYPPSVSATTTPGARSQFDVVDDEGGVLQAGQGSLPRRGRDRPTALTPELGQILRKARIRLRGFHSREDP